MRGASAVSSTVHLLSGAPHHVLSLLCQMQCHLHCLLSSIFWSHYEHRHICAPFLLSFRGPWTTTLGTGWRSGTTTVGAGLGIGLRLISIPGARVVSKT